MIYLYIYLLFEFTIDEDHLDNYSMVKSVLTSFIKRQKTFSNIQFYEVAGEICQCFGKINDYKVVGQVTSIVSNYFQDKQALYDSIAATTVPVT